jgi:hypothetical protein
VREFLKEENLVRGLRLALVATLVTALYFAYEYLVTRREFVVKHLGATDPTARFALDVLGAFVALFISATAGFAWARGERLVGFGSWRRVKRDLVLIVPIGAALALLTLFVLEPLLYKPLLAAKHNPFQPAYNALAEEVICRWGIFAIAFRLSRRVDAAVVVSAAFNVVVGLKVLQFHGAGPPWWQLAAILAVKFALATGYAVFYVRKGLLSTLAIV